MTEVEFIQGCLEKFESNGMVKPVSAREILELITKEIEAEENDSQYGC